MMSEKNKDKEQENNTNPFAQKEEQNENTEEQVTQTQEPSDEKELDKVKGDLENLNNQYIRLAADFDNYRKRQMQERESLLKYGSEKLFKAILPVLDTIDRAQKTIDETEDANILKESYNVVVKQLFDVLQKEGLEVIKAVGEEFDPNLHEAVMRTPADENNKANSVISELQKGYKIADKVLRATLVNVASAE